MKKDLTAEEVQQLKNEIATRFSEQDILNISFEGEPRDGVLQRFLQARKFDLDKTEKMIKEALEWRSTNDPKKLLAEGKEQCLGCGVEEVLQFYSGAYAHGNDKFGRPIWYERTGKIDISALHCLTTDDKFMQYHICTMEELGKQYLLSSTRLGKTINSTFSILDLEGLTMSKLGGESMEIIKRIAATDSLIYPETMGKMFVINSPTIFTAAWSVIKGFLDPRTVSKIEICGGPSSWKPKIAEFVDDDNLPSELGGKGPACLPSAPCFTELSLSSSDKKEYPMHLQKGESVFYRFFTASGGITMGATFTVSGETNATSVIPEKDYASTECSSGKNVMGTYVAPSDGVFLISFEHKGWWSRHLYFRLKKIELENTANTSAGFAEAPSSEENLSSEIGSLSIGESNNGKMKPETVAVDATTG